MTEAGLADVALGDLLDNCSSRTTEMRSITEASTAMGLRDDAPYRRKTGGTIAEAVLQLHAAKDAFGSLHDQPMFGWVGDVTEPLHNLQSDRKSTRLNSSH